MDTLLILIYISCYIVCNFITVPVWEALLPGDHEREPHELEFVVATLSWVTVWGIFYIADWELALVVITVLGTLGAVGITWWASRHINEYYGDEKEE